jgi:hypothetical protein
MLRPTWIYELKRNGFILADYIYDQARQKQSQDSIVKKNTFNVSLKQIRKVLGLPEPIKKNDKEKRDPQQKTTTRHRQMVIDPILDAIMEVEGENGQRIGITRHFDFNDNVFNFLEGYIEIELIEHETLYIKERHADRTKKGRKTSGQRKALPGSEQPK